MAIPQDQAERIIKIKVKKGEWTIRWQKKNEAAETYDTYEVTSKDPPLDELPKRLQVMANHVTEICEFPESATKNIVVSGISESYTDENRYLVITASRALSKSKAPMLINTPARPLYPEGDQDETFCMSRGCFEDLLAVEHEAMKYVRGERAQMQLDFEGAAKEQADEEEVFGFGRAAAAQVKMMKKWKEQEREEQERAAARRTEHAAFC